MHIHRQSSMQKHIHYIVKNTYLGGGIISGFYFITLFYVF